MDATLDTETPIRKKGEWKDKGAQAEHLKKIREIATNKRAELAKKRQEEVERIKQTKFKKAVVKKVIEDKLNDATLGMANTESEEEEEIIEVVKKVKAPKKKKIIKKKIVEISSDSSSSSSEEEDYKNLYA